MHSVVNGTKFNEMCAGMHFIKLLTFEQIHNGLKYSKGLIIDPVPFNPEGECQRGGMYFIVAHNIGKWLEYSYKKMYWIRRVKIPNNAQVYIEKDKFKADKFILGKKKRIEDWRHWEDNNFCKAALRTSPNVFKFIKNQTPELCLEMVKQNGLALEYVHHQTPELCFIAIRSNPDSLKYVKEQTPDLCLEAVKLDGLALEHVHHQTFEICLAAVQQYGRSLKFVLRQTPEICLYAVQQNGCALQYVKDKNLGICTVAINQHPWAKMFVNWDQN